MLCIIKKDFIRVRRCRGCPEIFCTEGTEVASNYAVMNILDFMDALGEDSLKAVLSKFSCPKNLEIQEFMQKNSIEFAKKKTSITYLLVDHEYRIYGIFAVTHKALQVMS